MIEVESCTIFWTVRCSLIDRGSVTMFEKTRGSRSGTALSIYSFAWHRPHIMYMRTP